MSNLVEVFTYVILPFLGWLGNIGFNRFKKRLKGNEAIRDTVRVNSDLIELNDGLLSKVAKLQSVLVQIKEEVSKLASEVFNLTLENERLNSENLKLKGRIKMLEDGKN